LRKSRLRIFDRAGAAGWAGAA